VDVEHLGRAVLVEAPEPERRPQARRLDRDVDALAVEELVVAGRPHVLAEREADVGVDVVLRRAGGVVGGCLFAVDRAPREECTGLVELPARLRAAGSMR
jgi:hypothetical protein